MSARETYKALQEMSSLSQHHAGKSDIVQHAVQALENGMGYEFLAVLVVTDSGGRMKPLALSMQGRDAGFLETDKAYVESKCSISPISLTNWVVKTGHSVRVGNVSDDQRYFGIRDAIQSELCVPLIVAREVIGVINTETAIPNAYKEADRKFLEKAAKQIAQIVNQKRLYKFSPEYLEYPKKRLHYISVCAWCNKLKAEENNWISLDRFPFSSSRKKLTHGICPDCRKRIQSQIEKDEL